MTFAIVDASGEIIKTISGSDEIVALNTPEGGLALPDPGQTNVYWDGGDWVSKGTRTSPNEVWNTITKEWFDPRPLDDIKLAKWDEMKTRRAAECASLLTVDGRVFDATAVSQSQISGAVTLAMLAPPDWTIDWTLADNTVATLTKAEMIGVGIALGARTNQIYGHARTVRLAIEAATTAEEVEAVVW